MSTIINKGLCWALAALQVNRDDVQDTSHPNDLNYKATTKVDPREILPEPSEVLVTGDENRRPLYTRREVANHCHGDSCWFVINNKVYDVTNFLRLHPGGEDIILEYGGHDASTDFFDKGHSKAAHAMLKDYFIGDLVQDDWLPEVDYT